jgi:sulfite reductase (NADPH) flavoprotein alpha-component
VAAAAAPAVEYNKTNPYEAEILEKIVLNGTGSIKETLHLELSLEGSGLTYQPGDALGIYPVNRAADVDDVLAAAGLKGDDKLGDKTLREALETDFDITSLSPAIAMKFNGVVGNKDLETAIADKAAFKDWIWGRQLLDLLQAYPHKEWTAESFTGILRPLAARLYSIASSLKAHEDEVHLTIAAVRYSAHDRDRVGVCSCYVADDVDSGDKVRVFFHTNNNFRLPENGDTDVIMVGPGTGIAPFRAFIEERAADESEGKNWLFFGDQHFSYDFLYQLEWLDYLEDGSLSELTTAFSRDQQEKIYVQHRLIEHGAEIWKLLEGGAHFYVCGDASRMAKDVHQALMDIAQEHGGKDAKEAKDWLSALRKEKRYQRDVY